MNKLRQSVVESAKKLIMQVIKEPAEDRAEKYLARPMSTARLLWNLQEIIDNGNDWPLSKLHRELGVVIGWMASREVKDTWEDHPDPITRMKMDLGVQDPTCEELIEKVS